MISVSDQNSGGYYRTGAFLRAKHRRVHFDSGRDFPTWALGLVPIAPTSRVLDAGCGWGRFTWALVDDCRIGPERIVGVDRSPGMIATAREEALLRRAEVCFGIADVEALPLRSATFDLVIAAHMLYDLPNLASGVHELARVLKPDGRVLATTNSDAISPLVLDLHDRAMRALDIPFEPEGPSTFSMENGDDALGRAFNRVTTYYFEDSTTWEDTDTFVADYATIGRYRTVVENQAIDRAKRDRLADEVKRLATQVLEREGTLRSPVLIGAFVCEGARFDQPAK